MAAARKSHGDGSGTPALVEVLLLHRHQTHTDVVAGITAALTVGAVSLDFVAVKTRKHALQHANPTPADPVVVILGRTPTAEVTEALLLDLRPAAVRLRLRQPAHRNEGRMTTNATTTS